MKQTKTLEFEETIEWSGCGREAEGVAHTRGQAVAYSVPKSMGGKGEGSSLEDLLASAVASCYTVTLRSLLARAGLPFEALRVGAQATVADVPERARVSEVQVSPTFIGADEQRRPEYESTATGARDRCFIGRHLAPAVAYRVGELGFAPATVPDGVLDVRPLPHQRRHDLIFETLDRLPPGVAITLVNDHDPLPLRHQMEATRGPGLQLGPPGEGPRLAVGSAGEQERSGGDRRGAARAPHQSKRPRHTDEIDHRLSVVAP